MPIKSMGLSAVAAVLAASLIACGQGQQQSSAAQQPAASVANAAGAMLMVQPASVDGCNPNQPVITTVSWHSPAPKNRVMVASPGQVESKLFSESGYSGSAKTGDWVLSGTRFTLTDASNGHVLAEQTVSMTPCTSSQG
jgi:hypothetical protein